MHRSIATALLTIGLAVAAPALAKNAGPKYKTVETRLFDRDESVELSPEFSDYLNAELRTELQKTKLFAQIIGQGEVVDAADVPTSVVVTGTLTEYKKGNLVVSKVVGFGSGKRSLKMKVNLARRRDQTSIASLDIHVRSNPGWNEKILAREAAKQAAREIKNALQHEAS